MSQHDKSHERLLEDLAVLKLSRIAEIYRETLDEAARNNVSMLEVLRTLFAEEAIRRAERSLQRRIRQARLPKQKNVEDYDFNYPKRVPKQRILRLFDCQFVEKTECYVFIGTTGTGKSHLLTALGYRACDLGIPVKYTRVIDMINVLTTAQINGTLEKALRAYVNPSLLLLDELGYLPIDKRGADLMFQVVSSRYESGSIVLTTNRAFKKGQDLRCRGHTPKVGRRWPPQSSIG